MVNSVLFFEKRKLKFSYLFSFIFMSFQIIYSNDDKKFHIFVMN